MLAPEVSSADRTAPIAEVEDARDRAPPVRNGGKAKAAHEPQEQLLPHGQQKVSKAARLSTGTGLALRDGPSAPPYALKRIAAPLEVLEGTPEEYCAWSRKLGLTQAMWPPSMSWERALKVVKKIGVKQLDEQRLALHTTLCRHGDLGTSPYVALLVTSLDHAAPIESGSVM